MIIEKLIDLDKGLLLIINGAHTDALDKIMVFFSSIPVWIPLYLLVIILLFIKPFHSNKSHLYKPKYSNIPIWIFGLVAVIGAVICFGLCDQIALLFKNNICRFRPSHDPELIVRTIDGLGGKYGFFSGHAANTFGFAVLTSLIFRRYLYTLIMLLWAATVSYSRMYLAKHFPLDVLCGAICGTCIAIGIYYLILFILKKINKRKISNNDLLHR